MRGISKEDPEGREKSWKRMGTGAWAALVVLVSLLAATMVAVYQGWMLGSEADVPTTGYVAMTLGVVLSLIVGFGLMALVFYSSRKGYDEPPVLLKSEENNSESD